MTWLALALAGSALSDCELEPTEAEQTRCIYMTARSTGAFEEARGLLAARSSPWALLDLANVIAAVGDSGAIDAYHLAEAAFRDGDPVGRMNAALGLRGLLDRAGMHGEADAALARARVAAGDAPERLARVDAEHARMLYRRSDHERAVVLARRADVPEAPYQARLVSLHVLAGALLELGRVEASWSYSQRLIGLTEGVGDAYVESTCRLNALMVAIDHPNLLDVDVLTFANETLAVAHRGGNPYVVTSAECAVAHLEADVYGLRTCALALRELDEPDLTAEALRHIALLEPDLEVSLGLLDEAEALAAGVGTRFVVAQVQNDRSIRLWQGGMRSESDAASAAAVRTVEAIRDTHGQELSRAGFATVWRAAWEGPAARWLEAGEPDKAWQWSEAMRARELLARRQGQQAPVVDDLLDSLWDDLTREERSERLKLIAEKEAEAHVDVHTLSLVEVQRALQPGEALVSYVWPTQLTLQPWAWWVTAHGAVTVPLDVSGVAQDVRTLESMEEPPAAVGERLRERLWDVLPHEGVHRLIVVPDGALHALVWRDVVGDLPVSVAPSASVWADTSRSKGDVQGVRSVSAPTGAALPAAAREARRWVDRFGGVLAVGDDAVQDAILGEEGVLHIATHGLVDPEDGGRGLQLADGLLTLQEISALDVSGKVVVLSVCQGADGPVLEAEGAMSITRAFLQAGARSVVASGVAMRDEDAEAAFVGLADRWAEGLRLDEAVAGVSLQGSARAVQVYGDGSPRIRMPPAPFPWATLAVVLGFVVAAGLGIMRTRPWSERTR